MTLYPFTKSSPALTVPTAASSFQVPHKVVGGEKSVSAVQHACLAACPAGWQHGSFCANTAASAWDRECGVAGLNPLLHYTTVTNPIMHPLNCTGTLWFGSADRPCRKWSYCADAHKNYVSVPLLSLHRFTKRIS